jgi:hypothetical protein
MGGLIPKPRAGEYVLVYHDGDHIRCEVWRGEVQITERRIGSMEVSGDNVDEAVARLLKAIETARSLSEK